MTTTTSTPAAAEHAAVADDLKLKSGAALQITGVTKRYGTAAAVDDVSLDIRPGQFVTLLGASGSGKTTLLRIVAGFIDANAGSLALDGQELSRLPVHKRNIGMVFQNYALFPHMSVEKNIAFPLARRKVPRADRPRLIDEALAAVELTGFGKRMPRELSGGQQQRVALARAIVAKPRLLLMDEPLGALDRRLREALQLQIRSLSRELGVTVINVTHDQEEALTMSDRIALLAHGRLEQYGTPNELYSTPANETVARFLGESNFVVAEGGTGTVFVRPHDITVHPQHQAPREADRSSVACTVRTLIYAGDSVKVIAHTIDGTELLARVEPGFGQSLRDGDRVVFSWQTDAALTLGS